jgi:hypothetical protein
MKKRSASSSGRRGISRIDQPSKRTHGWFVRVGYHERKDGSYGPRHTKFFGDAGHGGKKKALSAAEKFVASVSRGSKGRSVRKSAAKKTSKRRKRGR